MFRRNVLNNKQYGVLADFPLLTDGNEGLTAYNTIVNLTVATFRRKVAYLLVASQLISCPFRALFHKEFLPTPLGWAIILTPLSGLMGKTKMPLLQRTKYNVVFITRFLFYFVFLLYTFPLRYATGKISFFIIFVFIFENSY
jgi:hypothetical protein